MPVATCHEMAVPSHRRAPRRIGLSRVILCTPPRVACWFVDERYCPEMRRLPLFALVIAILGSVLAVPLGVTASMQGLPGNAVPAMVVAIEDGATLRVMTGEGEQVVRLAGLDPMATGNAGEPAECFGIEAIREAEELVAVNSQVWLEQAPENQDAEGRLLRFVWMVDPVDGGVSFLNESFLRRGLTALDPDTADDPYRDRLAEAEQRGRERRSGLWRACGEAHAPAGISPAGLSIPSVGIDALIEEIGITGGTMEIPTDPWNVGWYRELGALERNVNVVMSGHVDWWNIGPTIFYNLSSVSQGDAIFVRGTDGVDREFRVTSIWTVGADSTAEEVDAVIGPTDREALTLITCTGDFNGERYLSRLIVRAERV